MHVNLFIFHKSLHHANLLTALSFRIKCYSDSPLRNSSNVVTEKPKVFWIIAGMLQIDSFRETDSSFHIGCFHFEDFCQREAWKTAIRKTSGLSFWNVFSAKSWKLDVVMKFADLTNRQRSMSWLIMRPQLRDPEFMVQGLVRLKSSAWAYNTWKLRLVCSLTCLWSLDSDLIYSKELELIVSLNNSWWVGRSGLLVKQFRTYWTDRSHRP